MENKIQLVFEKEYSDKTELKFLPFITKLNACVSDEDYKALDNREIKISKNCLCIQHRISEPIIFKLEKETGDNPPPSLNY